MFTTELDVRALPGERWKVLSDLRWESGTVEHWTVPAGFVTDLASIPRWFQWAPHFGVNGRSRRAAVLHDFLYYNAARGAASTKTEADSLFRLALAAEGLNAFTCALYYWAVRLFGKPRIR